MCFEENAKEKQGEWGLAGVWRAGSAAAGRGWGRPCLEGMWLRASTGPKEWVLAALPESRPLRDGGGRSSHSTWAISPFKEVHQSSIVCEEEKTHFRESSVFCA